MYKVSYIGRKNFVKFDDEHYLLYLNEEQAEVKNEKSDDIMQGYAYTGSQPDGGTLVEAKDVNDDNRRAKFVAGLIGTEYDIDSQIAILANGNDTDQHAQELKDFEDNRRVVKETIDELLAREL
ncbi:hypothetical protein [Segatella hominis]|uniref:Uncharacterized protein n=1 Tax=Segatella hominis TaxID=2518605 RepID=A0A4Y8VPV1_9BACT|nr:hypothetical protein [Segatella hominis]TFH82475.1 hypothetical protein EXN75_06720 [Segatella hominis]